MVLWTAQNFSLSEQADLAAGMAISDSDADGRSNLEEYAFSTDPRSNDSASMIEITRNGGSASVRYVADSSKTDIAYQLEKSSDLGGWEPAGEGVISSDGDMETRGLDVDLELRFYYRLRVTLSP